jgi:two-component system phosphate regulon response regulator OmpR
MRAIAPRILIIDDDRRLSEMVATYMAQNGMVAEHVDTAATGLRRLRSSSASKELSAVILDLMLPDADGLDVCRTIRTLPTAIASIPVLMLTAKGDPMDRVVGLELGADDYLPKPFEPRELLARVRAILRRPAMQAGSPVLRSGDLEIDRNSRSASMNGRVIPLTSRQFDILVVLAECAGRVLSRDQLMSVVADDAREATDRAIDVQIGRLRAAIERDPKNPRFIITVRGAGYCLARNPSAGSS